MIFSTIALIIGFGVLITSDFVPTIYFGALMSLAMLGGMLGMACIVTIWMLVRVAAKADVVDGKEIRPGDKVALFAYGAHHNAKFWDNPEAFVPERWLGDAAKKRKPYTYLPFGGGKRSCIGGAMSQVENVLALSILLRRFRPEYVGPEPPGINATVTLTPKGGLQFKIRELS